METELKTTELSNNIIWYWSWISTFLVELHQDDVSGKNITIDLLMAEIFNFLTFREKNVINVHRNLSYNIFIKDKMTGGVDILLSIFEKMEKKVKKIRVFKNYIFRSCDCDACVHIYKFWSQRKRSWNTMLWKSWLERKNRQFLRN